MSDRDPAGLQTSLVTLGIQDAKRVTKEAPLAGPVSGQATRTRQLRGSPSSRSRPTTRQLAALGGHLLDTLYWPRALGAAVESLSRGL